MNQTARSATSSRPRSANSKTSSTAHCTAKRSSRVGETHPGKWKRADEDCEKYKAEADARGLKVEYLENKLEEKYHVENLFGQLKEDYEELKREKQASYEHMETRLIQKEEEIRKANIERDEVRVDPDTRFSERTLSLRELLKRKSSRLLS